MCQVLDLIGDSHDETHCSLAGARGASSFASTTEAGVAASLGPKQTRKFVLVAGHGVSGQSSLHPFHPGDLAWPVRRAIIRWRRALPGSVRAACFLERRLNKQLLGLPAHPAAQRRFTL